MPKEDSHKLRTGNHTSYQHIVSDPEKARQIVHDAQSIILLISGPDEDSIGAGISLKAYLRRQGKKARLISGNSVAHYQELPLLDEVEVANPPEVEFGEYDLTITLDTANPFPQLVDYAVYQHFELPRIPPVLSIDHHLGNDGYANFNIWEPASSSTCELVFKHFLQQEFLTKEEATLILLGMSYDTGHFRWATSPQTLLTAAHLIEYGGDIGFVVTRQYYSYDQRTLDIIQRWLGRLTYNRRLGYMVITLSEQEMDAAGLSSEEFKFTRSVFQKMFLCAVREYPIGFFLIEGGHKVRAQMFGNAFRNNIDLTRLSLLVGGNGGGHFNASGFVIEASTKEAIERIDMALAQLKIRDSVL